jgi:hypothetical protein
MQKTKIRAFAYKCGQKISTSVGLTKIRAFAGKCGQNCANQELLYFDVLKNKTEKSFRSIGCAIYDKYLTFLP